MNLSSHASINFDPEGKIEECINNAPQEQWVSRRLDRGKPTDYLYVKNGNVTLRIDIQLRYQHYFSDEEFLEATGIVEEAKKVIISFYKKYNINLIINFDHQKYNFSSRTAHPMPKTGEHVVYIRKNTGDAMKETYWGINYSWSTQDRGMIYAHELSHLFGLKDEYETTLADRIGEEDNIMREWSHPNARFYPHQIQEILSPLCHD